MSRLVDYLDVLDMLKYAVKRGLTVEELRAAVIQWNDFIHFTRCENCIYRGKSNTCVHPNGLVFADDKNWCCYGEEDE